MKTNNSSEADQVEYHSVPMSKDEAAFIAYLAAPDCRSFASQARFMIRQACMLDERFEKAMWKKQGVKK